MTKRRKKPLKKGRSAVRSVPPFVYEFRLKVARLYVEDHYPAKMIACQFGISDYSLYTWGKRYREHGEQGLVDKPKTTTGSKLPEAVSQSIVDLKKANPGYGARRISDILKRFFWLRTSPSTVQRTLREQGLTQTPKRKREKTLPSPGFLRSTRPLKRPWNKALRKTPLSRPFAESPGIRYTWSVAWAIRAW